MTLNMLDDSLKEACGVSGIILSRPENPQEAAFLSYLTLNALQHRGQESAGITSFDANDKPHLVRDMGLVNHVFDDKNLHYLQGHLSIGHARYSTTGGSEICNAQPLVQSVKHFGSLALAHNGNLVNSHQLKNSLLSKGFHFESNSDSEVLAALLKEGLNQLPVNPSVHQLLENIKVSLGYAKGSFSLTIALGGLYLLGVKDPNGLRPLCLGAIKDEQDLRGWSFASESCGLDIIGAHFEREVGAGEIILIDKDLQLHSTYFTKTDAKLCLFELIYFARPDSVINGIEVHTFRENLGRMLALTSPLPVGADLVIGVPDSGTPAAIGFARQSGVPFANGLIKNRYVGRTFIQPTQAMRQLGIRLKLNPLQSVISGKSVVLVDDSIVRGNTPRQLVKLLRQAGVKEVHLRISSPPIMWGCHYGIAMKDSELIAKKMNGQITLIAAELEVDSLAYLDLESILQLTNQPNGFCTACFSGNYPVQIPAENDTEYQSLRIISK